MHTAHLLTVSLQPPWMQTTPMQILLPGGKTSCWQTSPPPAEADLHPPVVDPRGRPPPPDADPRMQTLLDTDPRWRQTPGHVTRDARWEPNPPSPDGQNDWQTLVKT